MNNDEWISTMWVIIADIVMVLVFGFLAWKISLWALLGLIFLLGTKDKIEIILTDGTKIEAIGENAISKMEEIREWRKQWIMEESVKSDFVEILDDGTRIPASKKKINELKKYLES